MQTPFDLVFREFTTLLSVEILDFHYNRHLTQRCLLVFLQDGKFVSRYLCSKQETLMRNQIFSRLNASSREYIMKFFLKMLKKDESLIHEPKFRAIAFASGESCLYDCIHALERISTQSKSRMQIK